MVNISVEVGREGRWLRDGRAFGGHDTNQGRNSWLRDPPVLNLMIDGDMPLSRCAAPRSQSHACSMPSLAVGMDEIAKHDIS